MDIFIKMIKYLLVTLTLIMPTIQDALFPAPAFEASFEHIGTPLKSYYTEDITARTAWDVEIFDGKLFVASGDYDANSGPVQIYHYDIAEQTWINGGTVPDEQVERFIIIDGTLMAPGCDPREDWTFGNIYKYENNQWITYRNIPGGIHQFDLMEYDGKIFVGLGVLPGEFPIATSSDDGNTFQSVTMYKDGKPIDTSIPADAENIAAQIRVFDFFQLNGELYAFFYQYIDSEYSMEIYKYADEAFYFHSDLPSELSYKRTTFEIFTAKAELDGKAYFSTGKLYASTDMITAEQISLDDQTSITDLRVIDDKLYATAIAQAEDGKYRTSLWVRKSGKEEAFRELFYFTFDAPAQSFTYDSGVFYFGMGDGILSKNNPANGAILTVTYSVDQ